MWPVEQRALTFRSTATELETIDESEATTEFEARPVVSDANHEKYAARVAKGIEA